MNAEDRIRNAITLLIEGPVPPGRKCDITSLCAIAGVPRATLYRTYPHLKAQFDRQRAGLQEAGIQPDPRQAQIERLKREVQTLRERLSSNQTQIDELSAFRRTALSRIAAQHEEIRRLRTAGKPAQHLTTLPALSAVAGPAGGVRNRNASTAEPE